MKHITIVGFAIILLSGTCRAEDPPVEVRDNTLKTYIYQISDVKMYSDQNFVFIRQAGIGNEAVVVQSDGSNNVMILKQVGDRNSAITTQVGSDNYINATALGDKNKVEAKQIGDGNSYLNVRIGTGSNGALDVVEQQGNGHKAIHIQYDGSAGVSIQQRGNGLSQPVVVKSGRIGSF